MHIYTCIVLFIYKDQRVVYTFLMQEFPPPDSGKISGVASSFEVPVGRPKMDLGHVLGTRGKVSPRKSSQPPHLVCLSNTSSDIWIYIS